MFVIFEFDAKKCYNYNIFTFALQLVLLTTEVFEILLQ